MGIVKRNIDKIEEFVELDEQLNNLRSRFSIKIISQMLETLTKVFSDLKEDESKKVFQDKELGLNITSSLKELSKDIVKLSSHQEVSVKVMADTITKQNDAILKLLQEITKKDFKKGEDLLNLTSKILEQNSNFVERGLKEIDYTNNFKGIEKAISSRPLEWEFEIERSNNSISKIIAKAKNK